MRVPPPLVIEMCRSRSRTTPAIVIGPVPGSSAELERLQLERPIHSRGRPQRGDRVRAEQRHLQLPVLLQLESAFVPSLAASIGTVWLTVNPIFSPR